MHIMLLINLFEIVVWETHNKLKILNKIKESAFYFL